MPKIRAVTTIAGTNLVLALVPFYSLHLCLEHIRDFNELDHRELADPAAYPRLREYINEYLIPTWFGRDGRPPKISPLLWTHGHEEDLTAHRGHADAGEDEQDASPITTNSLESWHRTLNMLGQKTNHRFWNVWMILRNELGPYANQKYHEAMSPVQSKRSRSPAQKSKDDVKKALEKFTEADIPKSLTDLALASVCVQDPDHQEGYHGEENRRRRTATRAPAGGRRT